MNAARSPRHLEQKAPRRPGRPAGRSSHDGVIADREALLAAAERLIRERGPDVSLDAIAAEAGVTKPILYRGVGGREALANALSQRLTARMTTEVSRLMANAAGPRDEVRRLVGGYLSQAASDRHLYLYVTVAVAGNDQAHQSLMLADETAGRLAKNIAIDRTRRGADPAVATVWAYGLVGALHYVALWWLRSQSIDIDKVTDQITELLWSGVGLEAPPIRKRSSSRGATARGDRPA